MRKIKMWIDTGYANCSYEDEIEVPDDYTDKQINEELMIFLANNIDYGWSEDD